VSYDWARSVSGVSIRRAKQITHKSMGEMNALKESERYPECYSQVWKSSVFRGYDVQGHQTNFDHAYTAFQASVIMRSAVLLIMSQGDTRILGET
jgi:hypothetical protein